MKISSWNVNSLSKRLSLVLQFLKEEDIDVLCLQELKLEDDSFPIFDFKLAGYDSLFLGEKGKNGVAIISRHALRNVPAQLGSHFLTDEARFITAKISILSHEITIGNVYVPVGGFKDFDFLSQEDMDKWNKKLFFLRGLYSFLKSNPLDIVLGDFNIVSTKNDISEVEKANFICCSQKEREIFSEFLKLGYENTYNIIKPDERAYSWWSYQFGYYQNNKGYRLDHILCKKGVFVYEDICIKKEPWRSHVNASDHAPVILTISSIGKSEIY